MASSRGAAARNGSVPSVVTGSSPRVRSAKAAARASTSAPDSSTRRRAVRRLASWARSWRLAGSKRQVQARRASHAPCTGAARTATVTTTPTGSRSFRAPGTTQAAAAIPAAPPRAAIGTDSAASRRAIAGTEAPRARSRAITALRRITRSRLSSTITTAVTPTTPAITTDIWASAARAQMSVVIAGVVGVTAVVMVLLSRLLVIRRSAVIALERARGASVPAIALRLAAESVPIAALGGAAGIAAAAWVVPGALNDLLPVGVVVTVAVLAAPVQGAWLARRAWTGRREPANRQDRAQLAKRRTVRRLVLESGALVLALAAAFALRTRGLLQVTTEGTDPFLAAAPLLLAIAITVLLLRVYPWPIRVVGVLGRRTRGVLGLLGAARCARTAPARADARRGGRRRRRPAGRHRPDRAGRGLLGTGGCRHQGRRRADPGPGRGDR